MLVAQLSLRSSFAPRAPLVPRSAGCEPVAHRLRGHPVELFRKSVAELPPYERVPPDDREGERFRSKGQALGFRATKMASKHQNGGFSLLRRHLPAKEGKFILFRDFAFHKGNLPC